MTLTFIPVELFPIEPNGHKFSVGAILVLTGLTTYPEYNGQEVKITACREDGSKGKAYYIEGQINEVLNWVYEDRLKNTEETSQPSERSEALPN